MNRLGIDVNYVSYGIKSVNYLKVTPIMASTVPLIMNCLHSHF